MLRLLNIGFGNYVNSTRVISINTPDSAPIKRMVAEAREKGMLIDATCGRRTRSVVMMDNDHIVLSSLQTDTMAQRMIDLHARAN
jgi:hypothetical protein